MGSAALAGAITFKLQKPLEPESRGTCASSASGVGPAPSPPGNTRLPRLLWPSAPLPPALIKLPRGFLLWKQMLPEALHEESRGKGSASKVLVGKPPPLEHLLWDMARVPWAWGLGRRPRPSPADKDLLFPFLGQWARLGEDRDCGPSMNAGRAHEWATPKGGDLEPLGWSPHLPR